MSSLAGDISHKLFAVVLRLNGLRREIEDDFLTAFGLSMARFAYWLDRLVIRPLGVA